MSAAFVHPPTDVALTRDLLAHLRAGQHPVSVVPEPPVAEFGFALDPSHVAFARRREQIAGPPVAPDVVAADALGDDRLGLLAQRPQLGGVRGAEAAFEHAHRLAHAAADLPTVASARAPSHPFRLQHDDGVPPLGEVQGGGDSGEAGAHDAHVGRLAPCQRATALGFRRRGRVIGIGRLHGLAVNLLRQLPDRRSADWPAPDRQESVHRLPRGRAPSCRSCCPICPQP